jgi:hypothetical protein
MSILNIRPVVRGGSKVIIGIAGPSGSGKTYTALKVARGMVSSPSEIGFLDTENKRGSLYADILDGQFMIGDLYAPFSPKRYAEAIKEFQLAGVKVLVIDSVSHEWEGEGGCDDIANATTSKIPNWRLGKSEHKEFMKALLYSDMHIICCIRAREKTDFKIITKPVSLGIQPVCEKNFMFELTASIMMDNEGKNQKHLKVPSYLKKSFGDGNDYLGIQLGKDIIKWVEQGEKEDPEVAKCKSEMLMACEKGINGLMTVWDSLSAEMKVKMKPHMAVYKSSAKAYDDQKDVDDNATDVAVNSESARIIDSMKEISTLAQLESSKESFDLSIPEINEAYELALKRLK